MLGISTNTSYPNRASGNPPLLNVYCRRPRNSRAIRNGSRPTSVDEALAREIEAIAAALDEHGPTDRHDLARLVGARYWGPGRYSSALRAAVDEGRARRLTRRSYGPPDTDRG